MGQKLNHEQKGQLADQLMELMRMTVNGIRPFDDVRRGLQDIIDGKLSSGIDWWRTPEQQLVRARQLWPNDILPEPPGEFTPRAKSEVLLLHVPDSFDSLWNKVDAPMGYTKFRSEDVGSDKHNLRLAPNKVEYTEPVWLAFDPERGKGERPDSFWDQADVAASEVLSAVIQFPEWPLVWCKGASAPNLSGYRLQYEWTWSFVPYLGRWDDGRRLELSGSRANGRYGRWSSPSVREC